LHIQVNGEPREVDDNLTLPGLLVGLNLQAEQVAVELNQRVVRRAEWPATILRDGDNVEIVHFVGGGNQWQQAGAVCRNCESETVAIGR